jgi:hypothetical protein
MQSHHSYYSTRYILFPIEITPLPSLSAFQSFLLMFDIIHRVLFSLRLSISYYFFIYFFGGLECVGHSFAYAAHFVILRAVWIRTQKAAIASRRATNLATHLPNLAIHLPNLATYHPNLATHLPNLATHLPT